MTATVTDLSTVASQEMKGKRFRCIEDPESSASGNRTYHIVGGETWPMEVTIHTWRPERGEGRGNSQVVSLATSQIWWMPNRSLQPYVEPGLLIETEDEGYSAILVTRQHEAWHLARRSDGGYRRVFSFNPGEVYAGRWTAIHYLTREGMQTLATDVELDSWRIDPDAIPSGLTAGEQLGETLTKTANQQQDEALLGKAVRLTSNLYAQFHAESGQGATMYVAGVDAPVWIGSSDRTNLLLTLTKDEARLLTRGDHDPYRGRLWVRTEHFEVIPEEATAESPEAVPTTRTAEEARLAERVAELESNLRTWQAEARRHEEKVEEITDRLIEEADIRGWCSEYDDIAEGLGLRKRVRGYTATVEVTVSVEVEVMATDEDDAEEKANDEAEQIVTNAISGLYNVAFEEVTNTRVSEN